MFGDYINFIDGYLGYSDANSKTIANNIANVNTPDFKTQTTKFNSMLGSQMKTSLSATDESHITTENKVSNLEYSTTTESENSTRVDGNNVNQTEEMIKMMKNNYAHNMSVSAFNSEINLFKTAIGR